MDISIVQLVLLVIAMRFAVAVPVIYIVLGFSAVRILRDIRDIPRERPSAG
jgi:hypothetical protein